MPVIYSLVILDNIDGSRLFSKYYDGRSVNEQFLAEKVLYSKTEKLVAKTEGLICQMFVGAT